MNRGRRARDGRIRGAARDSTDRAIR